MGFDEMTGMWTSTEASIKKSHDIDGYDMYDSFELVNRFIDDGFCVNVVKTGRNSYRVMAEKFMEDTE